MKNKLMIMILGIFLFSFVSATNIGTFQQGQQMQITNYCQSADCTYSNLTNIFYPNGTIINLNILMTQEGQNFNYSYVPSLIGTYNFITCSNPNGIVLCEKDNFNVTPTGDILNFGQTSIFVLTELFLLLLLFLTFYINSKISNARVEGDEASKLFTVNNFRLVKPAIGFLSYIIFLVMTYAATSFVKLYDISGALGFMDTFLTVAFIGMFAVLVMVGWKIITEALISKQIWRELSLTNA